MSRSHSNGTDSWDENEKSYTITEPVAVLVYEDKDGKEYAIHGAGYLVNNVTDPVEALEVAKETGDNVAAVFGFIATDRVVTLPAGSTWNNDIVKENPNFDPADFIGILFGDTATHYQAMKL